MPASHGENANTECRLGIWQPWACSSGKDTALWLDTAGPPCEIWGTATGVWRGTQLGFHFETLWTLISVTSWLSFAEFEFINEWDRIFEIIKYSAPLAFYGMPEINQEEGEGRKNERSLLWKAEFFFIISFFSNIVAGVLFFVCLFV